MSKYSEFGPAIGHCSDFKGEVVNDNTETPSINYTWTDPAEEGIPYGGTILAIKEGSAPADSTDGYIVDTMDKDKYKTEAYSYQVSSTPGTKDIYATLFPYSANKSVNELKKHVLKSAVTVAQIGVNGLTARSTVTLSGIPSTSFVVGTVYKSKLMACGVDSNQIQALYSIQEDGSISKVIDLPTNGGTCKYAGNMCVSNDKLYIAATAVINSMIVLLIFEYDGTNITQICSREYPNAGISLNDRANYAYPVELAGNLYIFGEVSNTLTTFIMARVDGESMTDVGTVSLWGRPDMATKTENQDGTFSVFDGVNTLREFKFTIAGDGTVTTEVINHGGNVSGSDGIKPVTKMRDTILSVSNKGVISKVDLSVSPATFTELVTYADPISLVAISDDVLYAIYIRLGSGSIKIYDRI